jgi:hypothetical protein
MRRLEPPHTIKSCILGHPAIYCGAQLSSKIAHTPRSAKLPDQPNSHISRHNHLNIFTSTSAIRRHNVSLRHLQQSAVVANIRNVSRAPVRSRACAQIVHVRAVRKAPGRQRKRLSSRSGVPGRGLNLARGRSSGSARADAGRCGRPAPRAR